MGQERTVTEINNYSGSVDSCELLNTNKFWLSIEKYRPSND